MNLFNQFHLYLYFYYLLLIQSVSILFRVIEYINIHSPFNFFNFFLVIINDFLFIYLHRLLSIYLIRYYNGHLNLYFDFLYKKHIKNLQLVTSS